MKVIDDINEARSFSKEARAAGKIISLVPTMGFLHAGHGELMRAARANSDTSILSIFVNPTQFGPKEDYRKYPRNMDKDVKLAESAGMDAVFLPSARQMYPKGYQTFVMVEELTKGLCGEVRPGHFRGVTTVVMKLFNIISPHRAFFGKKDYQQYLVIRRMASDLNLDLEIHGVETMREPDGVAMSSRNSYLNSTERLAARCIPRALDEVNAAFFNGTRDSAALIEIAQKIIEKEPLAVIDYIRVCDTETIEDIDYVDGSARLLLAVKIGKARLIDNFLLEKTTWTATIDNL